MVKKHKQVVTYLGVRSIKPRAMSGHTQILTRGVGYSAHKCGRWNLNSSRQRFLHLYQAWATQRLLCCLPIEEPRIALLYLVLCGGE